MSAIAFTSVRPSALKLSARAMTSAVRQYSSEPVSLETTWELWWMV
jgi:hypothetical protein